MSYNIVMIQDDINKFLEYLEIDRGLSNNTLVSYHFYLSRFVDFATSQGVHNVGQISQELIHRYRLYLNRLNNRQNENLKKNTQNYHLIALPFQESNRDSRGTIRNSIPFEIDLSQKMSKR
mgnify:CR=1 FL=1